MAATLGAPTAASTNRLRTIPSASRMPARSWTQMSSNCRIDKSSPNHPIRISHAGAVL